MQWRPLAEFLERSLYRVRDLVSDIRAASLRCDGGGWGIQLQGIEAALLRCPMFPKLGLTRNGRKTEGERKGTIFGKAAEAREPSQGI